jgi:hypothetical protein
MIGVVLAVSLLSSVPAPPLEWTVERALRLLQEPALIDAGYDTCFRFMWMPASPKRRLLSVRTCRGSKGPELVAKGVSDWLDGSARPEVLSQRSLTEAEWDSLRVARLAGFWNFMPEQFPKPKEADGAMWVFESAVAGDHRELWQHVPGSTPFRELCQLMVKSAGIPLYPAENELLAR